MSFLGVAFLTYLTPSTVPSGGSLQHTPSDLPHSVLTQARCAGYAVLTIDLVNLVVQPINFFYLVDKTRSLRAIVRQVD